MSRRPSRRSIVGAGVAVAALVVLSVPHAVQGQAASGRVLRLSDGSVKPGEWITARGEGFAPGALVLVEVCGTDDTPELACDDQTAIDAEVDVAGTFEVPLRVQVPPAPCPCTVRAAGRVDDLSASAAIDIAGAPTVAASGSGAGATGAAALVPRVSVTDVELVGEDDWTNWFGASPTRTFRYTVRNNGPGTAGDLRVALRGGDGDDRQVLRAPPVGSLDAGRSRSFEVSVDLGPLAVGSYQVVGRLTGPGTTERFGATTSSFPWMFVIIPGIVIAEVVMLVSRNRMRDRVQGRAVVQAAAPAVAASAVQRVERTREVGIDTRAVAGRLVVQLDAARPLVEEPEPEDQAAT